MTRVTMPVESGQVRALTMLGTSATYRVLEPAESAGTPMWWIEVVAAPGLRARERFRFTEAVLAAMEVIEG